ncbi:hypothetical protein AACH06_23530 [Ideonella sp. DXS29W]|uniref:Uncharacterized protein n=1 Tax=Ideonella lacteola TaxID=2984193 RepID=A0ABU9BV02_9BURK
MLNAQAHTERRDLPTMPEFYDGTFPRLRVLAPAGWLLFVWLCMLLMLGAVGYLDAELDACLSDAWVALRESDIDFAAGSAARAFSGVTLVITLTLAVASVIWAASAFYGKAPEYRCRTILVVSIFLVVAGSLALWVNFGVMPFSTRLGQALLQREQSVRPFFEYISPPALMFAAACIVPGVLLAGATILLQPMGRPQAHGPLLLQLSVLFQRLRELDHMLYLGALTLVFGTLQLSAGLSIPLAGMPKTADIKLAAELCKTMAPAGASGTFFAGSSAAPAGDGAFEARCRKLPAALARADGVESLRQLVRGLTLCFGLAFSAMLAAIYVPALIGLRLMLEERPLWLGPSAATQSQVEKLDIGEVDPVRRIAAIVATLSPLLAGLVANAFSSV